MKETYTNWLSYEPPAIRAALPIEWVVGRLWDAWGAGPDMMPCPLPDHDDSTPSFNLWSLSKDGVFQRFGCFGCGRRGDAVDAIRLAYDVGFLEACRIAVEELLPEFEADDFEARRGEAAAASPEALAAILTDLDREGIDAAAFKTFLTSTDGLDTVEFARYAAEEWRWGAKTAPAIAYLPHFDPAGKPTGIKLRDVRTLRRWNVVGSRFPFLYGSWRPDPDPFSRVLVAEGETDTVWAAYTLRGLSVRVLGLPSGANQAPTPAQLLALRGRAVTLGFDGDDAGREATQLWIGALGVCGVLEVPDGLDLCKWRPDLREHFR